MYYGTLIDVSVCLCVYLCWSVHNAFFLTHTLCTDSHIQLFIAFLISKTSTNMSSAACRANKATMAELKLRRLLEHNHRLREELARPRVMVSIASLK